MLRRECYIRRQQSKQDGLSSNKAERLKLYRSIDCCSLFLLPNSPRYRSALLQVRCHPLFPICTQPPVTGIYLFPFFAPLLISHLSPFSGVAIKQTIKHHIKGRARPAETKTRISRPLDLRAPLALLLFFSLNVITILLFLLQISSSLLLLFFLFPFYSAHLPRRQVLTL